MSVTREECVVEPSYNPTIAALGSWRRRCVLYYFLDPGEGAADVDDVCSVTPTANDRASVLIDLYHRLLPKLDEVGLVEFDDRSDTVRCRDFGQCEPVVEAIGDVES